MAYQEMNGVRVWGAPDPGALFKPAHVPKMAM